MSESCHFCDEPSIATVVLSKLFKERKILARMDVRVYNLCEEHLKMLETIFEDERE